MAAFIIIATLVTMVALAAVLWPLWRESRTLVLGGMLTLGLGTFALYQVVGTPQALDPSRAGRATPQTLEQAIVQLKAELTRNPNQPQGWALLAQSYAAQGLHGEAADAYAKAVKLAPDQPELLVEAAQARALADPQNRFDEQAVNWLKQALAIQPQHQRARWFLGVVQRQQHQPAEAAKTWESLLPQVDARTAASLREQIDAARVEAGLPPLPAAEATKPEVAANAPALLHLVVDLAPEMKAELGADDSVFVFARRVDGPPMPVAAKRVPARDFPITVTLGDGDSPMPSLKLSESFPVQVIARISKSGQANRGPGDLESVALHIDAQPNPKAVQALLIDQVVE